MTRVSEWFARQRKATLIWVGILALVVLVLASVGVAKATDQPSFCRTCHEMIPYHDAWSQGPHKDVSCVECHVDAGEIARLQHKFVALKEVAAHIRGDRSFPRATPPDVPDERCRRCHERIEIKSPGFDHAFHAKRGRCTKCHATSGHSVTIAALKDAGIYSGVALQPSTGDTGTTATVDASTTAVVDGGKADLAGHVTVSCSRCHIMSVTACSACHKPKHPARGECSVCHSPGPKFVFAHPQNRPDCQTCHTKSAKHTTIKGACGDCHKQPGKAWSFAHPPKTANCGSCHPRPAGHRTGACSTCHAVGTSWAFRHPGSGATCTDCHNRPAGHRAGACTSCHNVGTSWAFRHTASRNCSSCHKPPSNHYGSRCSSCHSPSRAWRSATFTHARIPGGEHTYRSFACAKCHPSSRSAHYCTCHGSSSGPSD